MCKWGDVAPVAVKIPADLACTKKDYWRVKSVDSCIAPIVKALQESGIDMRGSCCGHSQYLGHIILRDGRTLIILNEAMEAHCEKPGHTTG